MTDSNPYATTLDLRQTGAIWRARLLRPQLDAELVAALADAMRRCAAGQGVVLAIEGSGEAFCLGGDLEAAARDAPYDPASLYDLWRGLSEGPFVSVALARGRTTAGGVGLLACCDIALCDNGATFGLPEMLFGLHPACVMPFLARRVGAQRAHYLTLTSASLTAAQALACGLVDAMDADAEALLRAHLLRLRRLSPSAIARYKAYRAQTDGVVAVRRDAALDANRAMFADPIVRDNIRRYVTTTKFPWE